MSQKLNYWVIEPARFRLDGGAMYGIIPKPLWNKVHPADELNRVDLALRLMVIKSDEKLVVIDTGIGDYQDEKFNHRFDIRCGKNPLALALEDLNFTVNDVTDLVITHLHFDHVGGIGIHENSNWQPVFPKAILHLHRKHHHYAHNATARDEGSFHCQNFDPIIEWYQLQNQLMWHENEEGQILTFYDNESLNYKCSHGHTPWLMHPYTNDYIYLTDLIPTSFHLSIPWVMGYDISPGITATEKKEFLNFICDKNLKVVFEHDPIFWGASLKVNDKGQMIAKESYPCETGLSYII